MEIQKEKCTPCEKGGSPMPGDEARKLAQQVPQWSLQDKQIERQFKFKDFVQAIGFVNRVAEVAEEQGHHPDIAISYSRVRLTLSTHAVGGLTRNDFILAARIDKLAEEY